MEYKIIEDGAVFKIKQLDAEGNSLGMLEGTFATHEEATAHILALKGETPTPEVETENEPVSEENVPGGLSQPETGEEGAPEVE